MFRRLPSGLPKDPVFPNDLKGLGYFINNEDEIRSIEDPKAYFKFFLTKNDRYNCLQREAMNEVIRGIISARLEALNLTKIHLPLGTPLTSPNLPIFISSNLPNAPSIIVLFYEHTQDLGIFAQRIIGGRGGINAGSAMSLVTHIQATFPSTTGIILANTGQLRWYRAGQKAVTQTTWFALPQRSAIEPPLRFDPVKNSIPGNRTSYEHVETIFNTVITTLALPTAKLYLIGVSDGAVQTTTFLNQPSNFTAWSPRIAAFASVASYLHAPDFSPPNADFKTWFAKRGRAFVQSAEPVGTFLADEKGERHGPVYGAPVYSSGEEYYSECMMSKVGKTIVDWCWEVEGVESAGGAWENPRLERFDFGGEEESAEGKWERDDRWGSGGSGVREIMEAGEVEQIKGAEEIKEIKDIEPVD